jgi:hypothetical protein
MERLNFGARARRRARFKRLAPWLWIASVLMMAAGVPGSDVGSNVLRRLGGFERGELRGIETSESAAGLMKFRRKTFQTRPDPTPTPEPEPEVAAPAAPAGSVTAIVYDAAGEFGLSGSYLASVAACESGLNPSAANPAGFYGLFQFDSSTWAAEGYGSIYDPVAQARTAARLIAAGQAGRWPLCA